VLLAVALLVLVACAKDEAGVRLDGARVEVLGVWTDAEAEAFGRVLEEFERRTGATVVYTSTAGADLDVVLDARLERRDPPDLAVLPQPGLVARYARRGALHAIGGIVGAQVDGSYASVWRRLGTVDGTLYALWFKAANKSLVWYSLGAFERAGVVPPSELGRFPPVVDALAGAGLTVFAVPQEPSDAWTYTDLFENLYLRLAGPARYDALAAHRIPWTDESVIATLDAMAALLRPGDLAASPAGSSFPDSVLRLFSPAPSAAMVAEGDFVPGVAGSVPDVEIGVDVDVFAFPDLDPSRRFVVGGGDAAVLLRRSPAADELLRFLATPDAGEIWAAQGGYVSPNEDVALTAYPDATSRQIARAVLEAGDGFRFDLSDLQPVALGGSSTSALWVELRSFVADPSDPDATAARIEAAADAAWAGDAVPTDG
jgi:ABC-type glycerol-3-phosphate transport system substrate-binding protein